MGKRDFGIDLDIINSMKLQGWCLISSWCTRISFQASLQAEVEPGNAKTYVPLIIALGFNPIRYGVLYTITCQIAYMTPPFGYNLFLMRAKAPSEIT